MSIMAKRKQTKSVHITFRAKDEPSETITRQGASVRAVKRKVQASLDRTSTTKSSSNGANQ